MNLDMLKCLLHMGVEKMVENLGKELPAKNPDVITPDLLRETISLLDESKKTEKKVRTRISKEELKRQKKREWYFKNRDKQREYMKRYHEKKKKEQQELKEFREKFRFVKI